MGVVTTAVGIGMCAKYGADAASQLISVSTEFLARRATKALAEMLKQEEEERQLEEHLMVMLQKNESITRPFLRHLSKHVHSKIRVDRALKRLKRARDDVDVWKEIQTKGFTQAFVSIYALCIIHVLSATVAAVFGRCQRQHQDSEDESGTKWDVSREKKIQCTEFCVRYFQDHGLDKLIEKVRTVVNEEVTLISEHSDDVNRELSVLMFQKVHDRVRRGILLNCSRETSTQKYMSHTHTHTHRYEGV